jgi:hypothetical protein
MKNKKFLLCVFVLVILFVLFFSYFKDCNIEGATNNSYPLNSEDRLYTLLSTFGGTDKNNKNYTVFSDLLTYEKLRLYIQKNKFDKNNKDNKGDNGLYLKKFLTDNNIVKIKALSTKEDVVTALQKLSKPLNGAKIDKKTTDNMSPVLQGKGTGNYSSVIAQIPINFGFVSEKDLKELDVSKIDKTLPVSNKLNISKGPLPTK